MALITCKDCKKEFSSYAKRCPNCGAKKPGRIGCGLVLVIIVGVLYSVGKINQPVGPSAEQKALPNIALKYDWSKGGFDTVMMADFTITNKNAFAVKDIEITCEHYAPSGTHIDSNQKTVYETVAAGKSKIVRKFNMGFIHSQAAATSCSVTGLKIGE